MCIGDYIYVISAYQIGSNIVVMFLNSCSGIITRSDAGTNFDNGHGIVQSVHPGKEVSTHEIGRIRITGRVTDILNRLDGFNHRKQRKCLTHPVTILV